MNTPFRRRKEDQIPRKQRKGMYILPSMFTIANLGAGFYAILQALQGVTDKAHFDHAAIAIGFAVFFDGLDGTIARLTNTASDFGRELDSLADVVTFGVAPAVLAYMWGFAWLPKDLPDADVFVKLLQVAGVVCFVFLAAGASRLARFNIQVNPQPSNPGRPGRKYFVGMPIPGGAGCIAATVHFASGYPVTVWWLSIIWLAFVAVLSFLMVSTWRFWSAKSIDFRSRHPFRLVILIGAAAYLTISFSRYVLFFLALFYLLSGVFARLSFAVRRNPSPGTPAETSPH